MSEPALSFCRTEMHGKGSVIEKCYFFKLVAVAFHLLVHGFNNRGLKCASGIFLRRLLAFCNDELLSLSANTGNTGNQRADEPCSEQMSRAWPDSSFPIECILQL